MTYDEKIELAKSLKSGDAVTLASGFGYSVGNYVSRLGQNVTAEFQSVYGSDVYVKLPEGCKYANMGAVRFPLAAITQ